MNKWTRSGVCMKPKRLGRELGLFQGVLLSLVEIGVPWFILTWKASRWGLCGGCLVIGRRYGCRWSWGLFELKGVSQGIPGCENIRSTG